MCSCSASASMPRRVTTCGLRHAPFPRVDRGALKTAAINASPKEIVALQPERGLVPTRTPTPSCSTTTPSQENAFRRAGFRTSSDRPETACRLSLSAATSKSTSPIEQCTTPALSLRYLTWPACVRPLVTTSAVTEPSSDSASSRADRNWPRLADNTHGIRSGDDAHRNQSPAVISRPDRRFRRHRRPRPWLLRPSRRRAEPVTRTVLPVPCGNRVDPRTPGRTPPHRRPDGSRHRPIDELGLGVVLEHLQRLVDAVGLARSDLGLHCLVTLADLCHGLNLRHQAHAARATGDGAHRSVHISRRRGRPSWSWRFPRAACA